MEFTVRAAMARSTDESDWEHDELRRRGLAAVQIFRNGKAVWDNPATYRLELVEAQRERIERKFNDANELDPTLYGRLDRDLRARWRRAGYRVPSLCNDMKKLFAELERDVMDSAAHARENLLCEILTHQSPSRT